MGQQYTVPFGELRAADRPRVGGKCASLGELIQAGLPVPDGFAVTIEAFEDYRDASDLRDRLADLVTSTDGAGPQALQRAHDDAVGLILHRRLPERVERDIRESYLALSRATAKRRGIADGDPAAESVPVAVRSSSVDEDGDAASFAGQQETYLWVSGADEVVEKVRECWASLYTPQAIAYRSGMEAADGAAASRISVAIQLMAAADVAGVTFTVSPRTGDRSVIAINASYGLGQSVVSGEVTPDEFWLSKLGPSITTTRIADKAHEYVPAQDGHGVVLKDVDEARRQAPCLSDAEVVQLAEIGMRVEKHYGTPQDIEWALERGADGTAHVMLLQSRPETQWKKRKDETAKAKAASSPTTGLLGLISATTKGRQA